MPAEFWAFLGTVVLAVCGLVGSVIANRSTKNTKAEVARVGDEVRSTNGLPTGAMVTETHALVKAQGIKLDQLHFWLIEHITDKELHHGPRQRPSQ